MLTMPAGKRPHTVVLQNPGPPVRGGDGGYTQTWTDLTPRTAQAAIEPATVAGTERVVSAGALQDSISHIVTLPYHPQVTTKTRVLFRDRVLSVVGVQNREERNVELVLACEEIR